MSNIAQKREIVKEISNKLTSFKSIILADYRGLTVEQDRELRQSLKKINSNYKVYKNTLINRAINGRPQLQGLNKYLEGPVAIITGNDAVELIKTLTNYSKKFKTLEIKVGIIEDELISSEEINKIAQIPSKEILILQLMDILSQISKK
jgi:large subunit ribosomal protein L10